MRAFTLPKKKAYFTTEIKGEHLIPRSKHLIYFTMDWLGGLGAGGVVQKTETKKGKSVNKSVEMEINES